MVLIQYMDSHLVRSSYWGGSSDNGEMIRISPSSGEALWSVREADLILTPVLETSIDEKDYVIAIPEGNHGNVVAISMESGDILWRHSDGFCVCYPVTDGNFLFVGCSTTNCLESGAINFKRALDIEKDHMLAIDLKTGNILWVKEFDSLYCDTPLKLYRDRLLVAFHTGDYRYQIGELNKTNGDLFRKQPFQRCHERSCPGLFEFDSEFLVCNGRGGFDSYK